MTGPSGNPLPKFGDPPIVESVLGVDFTPLEGWGVPHYGLFWETVRQEFPKWDVKPPLTTVIERFGEAESASRVTLGTGPPDFRCWYTDQEDRSLIQIQNGRFIHNWRKVHPGDEYPHYEQHIRPLFERNWDNFRKFLDRNGLKQPCVKQCEVTYFNHLEVGHGWKAPSDLPQVFLPWSGATNNQFLPPPDSVSFDISYCLPDKKGKT